MIFNVYSNGYDGVLCCIVAALADSSRQAVSLFEAVVCVEIVWNFRNTEIH